MNRGAVRDLDASAALEEPVQEPERTNPRQLLAAYHAALDVASELDLEKVL